MLDLPENLNELPKERRCDFIKKAYKRMALKWHPDKSVEVWLGISPIDYPRYATLHMFS